MELTTRIDLGLAEKLKNKTFFHKFFFARAKDEIAERIRRLRQLRTLKQSELAALTGMKQSAISRLEQADYAGWNFKTLARIAEALDARLVIDFKTREEVIKEYESRAKREARRGSSVFDALNDAGELQGRPGLLERGAEQNETAANRTGAGDLAFRRESPGRPGAAGGAY